MQSSSPAPPWRERFFDRLRAGPGARRTSTHRRGTRCDVLPLTRVSNIRIAGALRLRDFRPAVAMQTGINRGSRTPSREALPSNDLSGRCNRGSRTLDTAVMSCLLFPLSYIAVVDMVTSDAGTPRQHRCRVPVWLEPQPLAPDGYQDLGDDERRCWFTALIEIRLRAERQHVRRSAISHLS